MIHKIIEVLQARDYHGAGEYTEIAKGKYEMVTNLSDAWVKVKRKRKAK